MKRWVDDAWRLAYGYQGASMEAPRRLVKRWPLAARRDKRRDRCEAPCEAPVSDSRWRHLCRPIASKRPHAWSVVLVLLSVVVVVVVIVIIFGFASLVGGTPQRRVFSIA